MTDCNFKTSRTRPETAHIAGDAELTESGLPMVLCVGAIESTLEDLMYGIVSEDLETMRLIASLVKNRDYVYLEGTGFVTAQNGERLSYHLLHSVDFPQTHALPNRVRGNISIVAFWRQNGPNATEMYATGIIDPCGDMIRMLVVPGMASAFSACVKYPFCGQMRKLAFALDKANTESKQRGTPNKKNVCVTCSVPISGRRLEDFAKTVRARYVLVMCATAARWFESLASWIRISSCVAGMNAMDVARAKMLSTNKGVNYLSTHTSSTGYSSKFSADS
ncbi:unnamed protein product [Phytophthora lilii]|uniref:Unnamed protein product n=1 Tax=Phytophthora lilii TaxID=2077276 RepID=A0A9W6WWB9_9STRA|nr:unnamed protein product [Phytophthora lilii]